MNKNKQTFTLTLTAVFIVIGQILNLFVPSVLGLIRPDFALVFLFLSVMIRPQLSQAFIASILTITINSLFGTNPIFQLPSFFDRVGSALLCLVLFKLLQKGNKKLFYGKLGSIFAICTFVSGGIYMAMVYLFGNILGISVLQVVFQKGAGILFVTVLVTAVVNYFFGILVFKTFKSISRGAFFELSEQQEKLA